MNDEIIKIYKECNENFFETVKKSGLPAVTVHANLILAGIKKIQDKIEHNAPKFGSMARGNEAEEMFAEMFPDAVHMNKYWNVNNPVFDFIYKDLYIDVKYSSKVIRARDKNSSSWAIHTLGGRKGLDLFVVFCERNKGDGLKNPFCLVIPSAFVYEKDTVSIFEGGYKFKNFKVELHELRDVLDTYAMAVNMSKANTYLLKKV